MRIRSIVTFLLLVSIASPKAFPATNGPMEILCTGSSASMPYMAAIFKREPMTDAVVIPTRVRSTVIQVTDEVVRRYMRLYFPRSYEDLIEKYELLLLRGIDAYYFTGRQEEWMRRAIEEAGLGGLQDRSVMSMHTAYSIPWAASVTSDAFPNDADAVVSVGYHRNGPLEVILNEDPLLPDVVKAYKEVLRFQVGWWGNNLVVPKSGSQIYTWSKTGVFPEFSYPKPGLFPHILGWRYGKGYTWSLQDTSGTSFWNEGQNPYGKDVYFAMLMYATGRDIPEDVVMVHQLRFRFHEYAEVKGFILSLMEFVDRFGANTDVLAQKMGDMDEEWKEARGSYLLQDFQGSWRSMEQLLGDISTLRSDALKIKDRALLWIYVVEWLTVSGTFLVAAFSVWSLMVRRRLYRQVESTWISPSERMEL